MARGKHASSAEARRAREAAEAEAVAGRRKIADLTRENASLGAALDKERKAHTEDVRRLNGLVEERTSDQVADLRRRLSVAETGFHDRVVEAMEVIRFSLRPDRAGDLARVADILGVQYFSPDIAPLHGKDSAGAELGFSRRDRRRAPRLLTNARMAPYLDAAGQEVVR